MTGCVEITYLCLRKFLYYEHKKMGYYILSFLIRKFTFISHTLAHLLIDYYNFSFLFTFIFCVVFLLLLFVCFIVVFQYTVRRDVSISLSIIATAIIYFTFFVSEKPVAMARLGIVCNFFTICFFASPLSTMVSSMYRV